MESNVIRSERIGEGYQKIKHSSGLTMLLCPMAGFSSAYALFATNYGSIDTTFRTSLDEEFVTVPEGIAHFLEHKLFESEDGDAFTRYAKTGASANAFTSFDKTAYLFSCTDNFKESIEILLDFVTAPYFTAETVQKEQGIIGQEIMMYDDNPDWQVFFNLLRGMYHNHPVRIDIAGTAGSIAQIDDQLLYRCYRAFYNLGNMVLVVAGNFDPDVVLEAANRILKPAPGVSLESIMPDEPATVFQQRTEVSLPVAQPMFQIGFKETPDVAGEQVKGEFLGEILLEIICGECSPLYRSLYDQGLINPSFGTEVMSGKGHYASIFAGDSRNPDAVATAILGEIKALKQEGIPKERFLQEQKKLYGRYVRSLGGVQSMASALMGTYFEGCGPYDAVEIIANLRYEELCDRLVTQFDESRMAISIVRPVSAG